MSEQIRGPLGSAGTGARVAPFAAVVILALASLVASPRPPYVVHATLAVAAVVVACVLVPWRRLPRWAQTLPVLASFVPLALLVVPAVTVESTGLGVLALLPVLWIGLYGSRLALVAAVVGVAAVYVAPAFLVADASWADRRWAVLWVAISAMVGFTVHRLVAELSYRSAFAESAARRLQGVLAATNRYAVIGTDADGRIELFSTGAEAMLGWTRDDVVGRPWLLVLDPGELQGRADELGVELREVLVDGGRQVEPPEAQAPESWVGICKDGSRLPLEMSVGEITDRHGVVHGFIGIAADATRRRAAERRLSDSEANLAAVARVVRGIQEGQDVRAAIVAAVVDIAAADSAHLAEPDAEPGYTITCSSSPGLTGVRLAADEPSGASTVFRTGERLFLSDPAGNPLVSSRMLESTRTRSMLWEPVVRRGEVVAVLGASWSAPVEHVSDRMADAVALLAREAASVLERDALLQQLSVMASTDQLTGLPNRWAWDERLTRELARAAREGQPLAVAMLDVDHFKAFNDTFGHQAGDDLLSDFAHAAAGALREVDLLARWGGEEFVVALPGCPTEVAKEVLERVRGTLPQGQTCSVGLVQWDGQESSERLLGRADAAMYEAKQGGRDRLVVSAAAAAPAPWDHGGAPGA